MINSDRLFINMDGNNKIKSEGMRTVKLFKTKAERSTNICCAGPSDQRLPSQHLFVQLFQAPTAKLWPIDASASLLPFIFLRTLFALLMLVAGGSLDKYRPCRLNGYA